MVSKILIVIFLVIIIIIAIGQIIYFIPEVIEMKEMEGGGTIFALQQEVVHLRLENSKLKEYNQQRDEEIKELKNNEENFQKKESGLQEKINSSLLDQKILDLVTPANNVITHKDTLVYLLNNFNTYGEIRNKDKFELEENFIPIVVRVYNKHEYFGYALEHYRYDNLSFQLMFYIHFHFMVFNFRFINIACLNLIFSFLFF